MELPEADDSLYFDEGYFLDNDTIPVHRDSVSQETPRD
jgi:hypothetical protein